MSTTELTNEQQRLYRSAEARKRINRALSEILTEHGWPDSIRGYAEERFAEFAVRVVTEKRLPRIWAGKTHAARVRGALSSLQVLMGERKQFRTRQGKLRDAQGNVNWVLDCWEAALDEWEHRRQLKLL